MNSVPAPSVNEWGVTLKLSERTSIQDNVLKKFLKSDKNSGFYSHFNMLRNKKNTLYNSMVWSTIEE